MKKSLLPVIILIIAIIAILPITCTRGTVKNNGSKTDKEISLDSVDIEKKYLTEGFISSDLYRVVIVTPKETGQYELDAIQNKARKRAQVSIEKNLSGSDIPWDRNTRAAIINLINQNGQLSKKDIDHSRFSVFYYDITRKNMKNYLKSVATQK